MKRAVTLSLALLLLMAIAAPAAHSARPASRLELEDCRESRASVPIRMEEARELIPSGFEPTGRLLPASGQEEIVMFDVVTTACGDEEVPEFEMAETYLGVIPPKELAAAVDSHRFIVDVVAEGTAVPRLQQLLCTEDLFEEGAVESTQLYDNLELDVAGGVLSWSYVRSSALTAQILLEAVSPSTASDDFFSHRWFYEDGEQVRWFDSQRQAHFALAGEATVTLGEETPAGVPTEVRGAGLGVYAEAEETFLRPSNCRG